MTTPRRHGIRHLDIPSPLAGSPDDRHFDIPHPGFASTTSHHPPCQPPVRGPQLPRTRCGTDEIYPCNCFFSPRSPPGTLTFRTARPPSWHATNRRRTAKDSPHPWAKALRRRPAARPAQALHRRNSSPRHLDIHPGTYTFPTRHFDIHDPALTHSQPGTLTSTIRHLHIPNPAL